MVKVKLTVALVLLALVIIVIFQNMEPVPARLLFFEVRVPVAALVATAMLLGIAIGILAALALSFRKSDNK